ncbi:TPA: hypothetical protein ACNU28_004247, partial [Aeromonas salmonicida subsp. salmonicida]
MIPITTETKNKRFNAIKLHLTRKVSTKLRVKFIRRQIRPKREYFGNYPHRGSRARQETNYCASVYLKWLSKWGGFATGRDREITVSEMM